MSELKDLFGFLCLGFIAFILLTSCTPMFIFFIASFLFIFLIVYGVGCAINSGDDEDSNNVG